MALSTDHDRSQALLLPESLDDYVGSETSKSIDRLWSMVFRIGFPLARLWWRLRRPRHEGALVAVYVGEALLFVRSSYRSEWNFPGGGVRGGETPEAAARRELAEEVGLATEALIPAGEVCGLWDWRQDRVHFFEVRLPQPPRLQLDHREIIAARLMTPDTWHGLVLTGPVSAYLAGRVHPDRQPAAGS